MLCEAFDSRSCIQFKNIIQDYRWEQPIFLFTFFFVVIAFQVNLQKPFKLHDFTYRNKTFDASIHIYRDRCTFHFRIGHLTCNSTFADQLIKFFLMLFAINLNICNIGRTYSLMRFLSSFALCMILAELIIGLTISIDDSLFCRFQSQIAQVYRIGTHVSN